MKNRSDINRMASMMGKVKNGLHMMGDGSGKEKRVTKKAMKEEAKSAPTKMPVKTQTSIEDSYETGKNIKYRMPPINPKRAAIGGEAHLYHPDDAQFYTKAGISDANWSEMQHRNRKQVDNWNIDKHDRTKYERTRLHGETRVPDKMYNHSTGKKQPTGRELFKDRNDKRDAETRQYLKALREQQAAEAELIRKQTRLGGG